MAQPNYKSQKRQKELQKKKKMEQKRQRKLEKGVTYPGEDLDQSTDRSGTEIKDE